MGRKLRVRSVILGLLIGFGSVGILLRQVDLKQSWNTLAHLNGTFMVVPLAMLCLNLPLRAWRWQLIFPSSSRPGFGACLTVLGIGNMANLLLPARAGDLARCILLQRTGSLAASSRTLATLAVEKVLDGLALIAMVLLSVWALHPPLWVLNLLRVAAAIFGGVLVLLLALGYRAQAAQECVRRILRFLHLAGAEAKVESLLSSFTEGLSAVSSCSRVLILLLITAVIWLTEAGLVWGLSMAMGLAVPLTSAAAAAGVLGLGLMIPAAPGGLGTYELFGTETLKLAGVAAASALALTIVIHAWVFITNIAFGVCLLALQGISMAQLRDRLEIDERNVETPVHPSI